MKKKPMKAVASQEEGRMAKAGGVPFSGGGGGDSVVMARETDFRQFAMAGPFAPMKSVVCGAGGGFFEQAVEAVDHRSRIFQEAGRHERIVEELLADEPGEVLA